MAAHGGLAYLETSSARAQRSQRRLTAVTAILSMACATALIGAMAKADDAVPSAPPPPSPLHLIRI
jgi:succinate dehydrogenase hydrophobic anchor subunit